MLVLSRHRDEQIVIGHGENKIVITVVELRHPGKVRLGIEAPSSVPVHRMEVYNAILQENPKRLENSGK